MHLSLQATKELKEILKKEIGPAETDNFSNDQINDLGVRLLELTSVVLKRKIKEETNS